MIAIQLYKASVVRKTSDADSEFQFLTHHDRENPIMSFVFDLKIDSTIDDLFRDVSDKYNDYSERNFDSEEISLYFQARKNAQTVSKIESMETFRAQLKSLSKKECKALGFDRRAANIIHLAAQGPQDDGTEPASWPRDSDLRLLPPLMPATTTHAAKLDHEKNLLVNEAILKIYNDANSPLYHGFNLDHLPIIKAYLLSTKGSKLLDDINKSNFPLDIHAYLDPNSFLGGWNNPQVLVTTKNHIPSRESCKPDPGKLGKIPLAVYPAAAAAKPSGSEIMASALTSSLDKLGDSLAQVGKPAAVATQEVHVRAYASLDAFLDGSSLTQPERDMLTTAFSGDLSVLAECVEASLEGGGRKEFHAQFLSYVPLWPEPISSMRLLARAKQQPPPPQPPQPQPL
jgi:hypothetical protein